MVRLRRAGRTSGCLLAIAALAAALAACGSSSPKAGSTQAATCAGVTVASAAARGATSTPLVAPIVGNGPPVTAAPSGPSTPAPWPAPSDPMSQACKAGLVPETAERLEFHVHADLDVFVNGTKVLVPAGLGIDTENSAVHSGEIDGLAAYGGIDPPCDRPCISPLHTHDVSGILHTESATRKYNTLGQLFIEWNVLLTPTCVATYCEPATPIAVYVNGTKFNGDPRTIPLSDRQQITVVVGRPPARIPNTADWTQI